MKREPKRITCENEGCEETFMQFNSLQTWCSPKCGYELSQLKLRKKEYLKALKPEKKQKTNSDDLAHQLELTQAVFNRWVRLVKEKEADCCISCEQPRGTFKEQAGHFKSVGHAEILRFEPDNVHLQCYQCNEKKGGNIALYRINLVKKIGLARVEWLEREGHKIADKWEISTLKKMRRELSREIREAA